MGKETLIAWTDHTFNPWMGCHKVSAGCKHCYAETMMARTGRMGMWGLNGERRLTKGPWKNVHKWNREAAEAGEVRRVFTASLADVFEDFEGPNEWRESVWSIIRQSQWLDFQLLTKRPENIARMLPADWGEGYPNVWLGTSIEDQRVAHRAWELSEVPAAVRFISYEPAIGPLSLDTYLDELDWVIVGGESGPGYRPMDLDWARSMRRQCRESDTAFFFKQSAAPRTEMGIELDGEIVREYPRGRSFEREATRRLLQEGAAAEAVGAVGS